jgi:hypothetical protein
MGHPNHMAIQRNSASVQLSLIINLIIYIDIYIEKEGLSCFSIQRFSFPGNVMGQRDRDTVFL